MVLKGQLQDNHVTQGAALIDKIVILKSCTYFRECGGRYKNGPRNIPRHGKPGAEIINECNIFFPVDNRSSKKSEY